MRFMCRSASASPPTINHNLITGNLTSSSFKKFLRNEVKNHGNKIASLEPEIRGFKQLLASTDYKALKYADGVLTDEEYEPTRLKRQELRDKINTLEWELEEIRATDIAYQAM